MSTTALVIPPVVIRGIPVTSIGDRAFAGNWDGSGNQLTSVTIPEGVRTIDERAFADNPLASVTIPDSVASFNMNVFAGARNLTRVSIGANVNITGTEAMAFNFRGAYLVNQSRAGVYTFNNNTGMWNLSPR